MSTIALSLVSHTNVGKTTLARTLTRRDLGEVRDEAHVTQEAERALLLETDAGDRLELWDTPGFGDSVRLARRLEQAGNPIGWFLSEVWDRFRDRAFWSSQRAIRHVMDQADVVLYLVDASQSPATTPWLAAELRVLGLLRKPVIVLLNQLGAPRAPAEEAAERDRWRRALDDLGGGVQNVLALDAFARCWVQEDVLLAAVAAALPPDRTAALDRLRDAWQARSEATWAASVEVLAGELAELARDRERVDESGLGARLKAAGASAGAWLGLRDDPTDARALAMASLADRAALRVRRSTNALIRLHGLDGQAAPVVLERVASRFSVDRPLPEGKAALWGGVLTGALAGLKADLASGGLTLGGGLLAGGLLGALGAAGLARGFNLVRGRDGTWVGWSDDALNAAAQDALLRYLAVAHYGRGRGEWTDGEHPAFWEPVVGQAVSAERDLWRDAWHSVPAGDAHGADGAGADALRRAVDRSGRRLLDALYPGRRTSGGSAAPSGSPGSTVTSTTVPRTERD
jgi:hypothetical protein